MIRIIVRGHHFKLNEDGSVFEELKTFDVDSPDLEMYMQSKNKVEFIGAELILVPEEGEDLPQEETKTSEEWQDLCKVTVTDPDGWDRANFREDWFERKIMKGEFIMRANKSIVSAEDADFLSVEGWDGAWRDNDGKV